MTGSISGSMRNARQHRHTFVVLVATASLVAVGGILVLARPRSGLAQPSAPGTGSLVSQASLLQPKSHGSILLNKLDKLDRRLRALVEASSAGEVQRAKRRIGQEAVMANRLRMKESSLGDDVLYLAIKSNGPVDLAGLAEKAVSTPWPMGQVVTLVRIKLRNVAKVAGLEAVTWVEDAAHPEIATDEAMDPGVSHAVDPVAMRARMSQLKANDIPFAAAPPLAAQSALGQSEAVRQMAELAGSGIGEGSAIGAGSAIGERSATGKGSAVGEGSVGSESANASPGSGSRPEPAGWSDVLRGHRSALAWAKGWRGEGVRIGVSDTGVDFGTPELQGTWAVISDTKSAFNGWPQALDAQGLYLYVQDSQLGSSNAAVGGAAGMVSTTQTSRATRDWDGRNNAWGTACFRRVLTGGALDASPVCNYKVPMRSAAVAGSVGSQSGVYRFGVHPDATLLGTFGERPGVLVVDQGRFGVYDTVYVDLDNDHDFTDEKPVTKASPLVTRDMDGDGWVDISGGLLYWIADGVNQPPGGYLWGDLTPTPGQGELVAFIGPWSGTHGTMCASNMVGQGRVPVPAGIDLSFRDLPGDGKPAAIHTGSAPGAKLVAIHYGGTIVAESTYIYAAYGHDKKLPGDELQVLSNSYGYNEIVNEGWDYTSRLLDFLTTQNPTISYFFSSGNGGPGYGSIRGPNPKNAVKVAASTQFGSTGYDSITDTKQITWGDIIAFSSNGPASDGTAGPHIAADGAFASGAIPVNGGYDGRKTIVTWGGTSRSTPVAAGNMALVYQAFKSKHNRWPSWEEARAILMAGAQYTGYDSFVGGAGVLDAAASTAIAGGLDGVYARPELLIPGDYRGQVYDAFPHILEPGSQAENNITLYNDSAEPTTLDLSAQTMRRLGSHEFQWASKPVGTESPSYSEVPDYVIPIPRDKIPFGTDLMAVRMNIPLEQSDLGLNYTTDNAWYLRVYQHTDVNGNGQWWTDRDGDGVVDKAILPTSHQIDGLRDIDWDKTELDRWEYERLGQDTRPNNNELVWVHHPLERWADGMYIGLQHASRPATGAVTTTISFRLDFYHYEDWPWLKLSDRSVTVPAGGTAMVKLTTSIPDDASYGYYQGAVFGQYREAGPEASPYRRLTIPVQLNVAAELDVPARTKRPFGIYLPALHNGNAADGDAEDLHGSVALRGAGAPASGMSGLEAGASDIAGGHDATGVPGLAFSQDVANAPLVLSHAERAPQFGTGAAARDTDLPYPNGLVRGANRWNYSQESGDWRFFFLDVPSDELPGTQMVVHGSWSDGVILGPNGAEQPAADIDTLIFAPASDRWTDPRHPANRPDNLASPSFFGPHTIEQVGASVNMNTSAGVWRFQTATGRYEEWVTGPVREGLNQIMAHSQLISGRRFELPFDLTIDRARILPTAVRDIGSGCQQALFQPTFKVGKIAVAGYGPSPVERLAAQPIRQDTTGDPASASWTRTFSVSHGALIDMGIHGQAGDDLDLFLFFDANKDGTPEQQVAVSAGSTADEAISYRNPADGLYTAAVLGYAVANGKSSFDATLKVVQGDNVSVRGLAGADVAAGQLTQFDVCYSVPRGAPGEYVGELVFGPEAVPGLFRVPVEVWGAR